ncbi:hypothetical protein TKK_0017638 [Trichogramma kaykai]
MLFFNLLFWLYNKVALLAIDSKDDAYRLYGECMCVHKDVIRELLYKNATKCLNATVPKKNSSLVIFVTMKSPKIELGNGKSLFYITGSDETGHIKINCDSDNGKRFWNVIKLNKAYKIQTFAVVNMKKYYNYLRQDFEINILSGIIVLKGPDNFTIAERVEPIVDLNHIVKMDQDEIITVAATVQKINLTLWGAEADLELKEMETYIFKYVTISNDNFYKALNSMRITMIEHKSTSAKFFCDEDVDEEELSLIVDSYSTSMLDENDTESGEPEVKRPKKE